MNIVVNTRDGEEPKLITGCNYIIFRGMLIVVPEEVPISDITEDNYQNHAIYVYNSQNWTKVIKSFEKTQTPKLVYDPYKEYPEMTDLVVKKR